MCTTRLCIAAACLTLCLACGRGDATSAPSPTDALARTETSADLDFHYAAGDAVDAASQQAFHEWAVDYLSVRPSRRLTYNKYRDRSHLQRLTGQLANGWADPATLTVHSVWPSDPHEAIHIYSAGIGRPSDFFNEGIAVALAVDPLNGRFVPLWNSTSIDAIASGLSATNRLPRIATIVETTTFRQLSDQTSYPVAGSFVRHLLEARGVRAVTQFFAVSGRGDDRSTIAARFRAAFGRSLEDAEADWISALTGVQSNARRFFLISRTSHRHY